MTDPVVTYAKPLPRPSPESAPFWEACRERRLSLQRCARCASFWFPPSPLCPECLSDAWSWETASGRGTLFSFVIMHRVYHPGFADDVPYAVAVIALGEGPRLIGSLVDHAPAELRVGMPVEVTFESVTEEVVLPRWRPVIEGRGNDSRVVT
jgi:uncharacterized OB-fold protein